MGLFDKFSKKNVAKEDILLNIEKTDVLDGVATDKKGTLLIMLLADGMDWHDEEKHLFLLQEKLNNYIAYIESKQYLERYPKVENIKIEIKFLFKETENCKKFLEHVIVFFQENMPNVSLYIELGNEGTFK